MTYTDYPDYLALLTNILTQSESLFNSLEQTVGGIGLNVNANNVFKKKGPFPLYAAFKISDLFTYLSSNISSSERDVIIHLAKMKYAIDMLSIIWKPDKIKWNFSKLQLCPYYSVDAPHGH